VTKTEVIYSHARNLTSVILLICS